MRATTAAPARRASTPVRRDAFPQAGVLDASRCISYLTIELRDHIPAELRSGVGDWLFGCDVCQEVCPWNRFAPVSEIAELQPLEAMNPVELVELFSLTDDDFRRRFRKTPLWRPHRDGLLRNAAIVLGNQGEASALPALRDGVERRCAAGAGGGGVGDWADCGGGSGVGRRRNC